MYFFRKSDMPMSSNVLLLEGECSDTHLAPAVLAHFEQCTVRELSVATLHSALAYTQEQALISVNMISHSNATYKDFQFPCSLDLTLIPK